MESKGKILIVDDDALVLRTLHQIFRDEYEVILASSGAEALEAVGRESDLDAIILDIKMARMDGLQTATRIKESNAEIPIIFHTGHPGEYSESRIENDFEPFDYVGKDERPARLRRAVRQAVSFSRLKRGSVDLAEHARNQFDMVGITEEMLTVYRTIEKIGPTNNKVIIYGATGTGKELVARALHKMSRRSDQRLVICNCNHRPPDLVESELFGHLKGSFTGAIADRVGLFEYADGGTLFLDEIGDLDITTQGKLLRVLETGEMHRLGTPETVEVDVRLICATHRDLPTLVKAEKFREDLYYRLKGVTISLPCLKDRREDIPLLIDHFTQAHCKEEEIGMKVFEPAARDVLVDFDWPGNVRQLMDTIQSLIDLSPSQFITVEEVTGYLACSESPVNGGECGFSDQVREFKRTLIIKALDRSRYNVRAAARDLALDPANLRKLMKSLGIAGMNGSRRRARTRTDGQLDPLPPVSE